MYLCAHLISIRLTIAIPIFSPHNIRHFFMLLTHMFLFLVKVISSRKMFWYTKLYKLQNFISYLVVYLFLQKNIIRYKQNWIYWKNHGICRIYLYLLYRLLCINCVYSPRPTSPIVCDAVVLKCRDLTADGS